MQRVIGYIDGFNLYYGLRQRKWRQFYWIDPFALVASLLAPSQQLVGVKYFTARVRQPKAKRDRQSKYLDAIRDYSQAEIILGKYYRKPQQQCRSCGNTWSTFEEKMTDCAIASHMVADAFRDQFDTAVLVGGDTDLVPPVKMVRRWFPEKRIIGWFPPARKNQAVADVCHDEGHINGGHLALAVMPDTIEVAEGVHVERPPQWS